MLYSSLIRIPDYVIRDEREEKWENDKDICRQKRGRWRGFTSFTQKIFCRYPWRYIAPITKSHAKMIYGEVIYCQCYASIFSLSKMRCMFLINWYEGCCQGPLWAHENSYLWFFEFSKFLWRQICLFLWTMGHPKAGKLSALASRLRPSPWPLNCAPAWHAACMVPWTPLGPSSPDRIVWACAIRARHCGAPKFCRGPHTIVFWCRRWF